MFDSENPSFVCEDINGSQFEELLSGNSIARQFRDCSISKSLKVSPKSKSSATKDIVSPKDEFIKNYREIKPNPNESFKDRMKFDIYKRSMKLHKYEIFIESQKKKLSKEDTNKLFNRLYKDTKKRSERHKSLSEFVIKKDPQRKM